MMRPAEDSHYGEGYNEKEASIFCNQPFMRRFVLIDLPWIARNERHCRRQRTSRIMIGGRATGSGWGVRKAGEDMKIWSEDEELKMQGETFSQRRDCSAQM